MFVIARDLKLVACKCVHSLAQAQLIKCDAKLAKGEETTKMMLAKKKKENKKKKKTQLALIQKHCESIFQLSSSSDSSAREKKREKKHRSIICMKKACAPFQRPLCIVCWLLLLFTHLRRQTN